MSDATENTSKLPDDGSGDGSGDGGARAKPHWSRYVLVGSLALNFVILGLAVGAAVRHGGDDPNVRPLAARDLGFAPYVGALDEAARRDVGRAFIKLEGGPRVLRAELRSHFIEVLEVLETSPFDAARFSALVTARQDKVAQSQAAGMALLIEKIDAMSDAERTVYAARLKRALTRKPRDELRDGVRDGTRDTRPPKPRDE